MATVMKFQLSASGGIRLEGETTYTSGLRTFVLPPAGIDFYVPLVAGRYASAYLRWDPLSGFGFGRSRVSKSGGWDDCGAPASRQTALPQAAIGLEELAGMGPVVFPNPSPSGLFQVEYFLQEAETTGISLFNNQGQKIYEQSRQLDKGFNRFEVEIPGLAAGIYLLRFQSDKGIQTPPAHRPVTKNVLGNLIFAPRIDNFLFRQGSF